MSKTVSLPKLIVITSIISAIGLDTFTNTKISDIWLQLMAESVIAIAIKYIWTDKSDA